MSSCRNQRGSTLPLTLLLVLLLTVIIAAGFARVSSERRVNADLAAQIDAYAVATSGLEQYMAGITAPPAAAVADSVTNLVGGKAYINIWRLRSATGPNPAMYVIASRGINTGATRYDPNAAPAERVVARYAIWQPANAPVTSAWTSITGMHKNGGSGTLSGTDHCGQAPALAGVAVPTTAADGGAGYTQNGGSPVPTGNPPIANIGANPAAAANAVPIDWNGIVNGNAITPTVTITSGTTGWPSFSDPNYWPTIHIKQGSSSNFSLPSSGRGLLIVDGNLTISGNTRWDGLILVGGTLTSNGNNTMYGAVISGLNVKLGLAVPSSDVGNGTKTYQYDSCNVANALQSFATFVSLRNGVVDNWPTY